MNRFSMIAARKTGRALNPAPEVVPASWGTVVYEANNSRGVWWLGDEDWENLEKAGWTVEWVAENKEVQLFLDSNNRYLGALAKRAHKRAPSLEAGIEDWEKVLGLFHKETGCYCCGPPHEFEYQEPGKE